MLLAIWSSEEASWISISCKKKRWMFSQVLEGGMICCLAKCNNQIACDPRVRLQVPLFFPLFIRNKQKCYSTVLKQEIQGPELSDLGGGWAQSFMYVCMYVCMYVFIHSFSPRDFGGFLALVFLSSIFSPSSSSVGFGFYLPLENRATYNADRKQDLGDDSEVFSRREYDKENLHIFYLGCMSQLPRTEKVVKIRNKILVADWNFHVPCLPGT